MSDLKRSSLPALLLAVCMLSGVLTGCTGTKAPAAATSAPTQVSASAPAETTAPAPSAMLEQQEDEGSLKAWELSPSVWSSSNGATITVTAQPREYVSGQAAAFVVRLDGSEVVNQSCKWDGTAYTASADLDAKDGYEYDFILFPPAGSGEHFAMSGAYDALVNLESSLSSYCNLFVSDYLIEDGKFKVTAGFANVQLPRLVPVSGTISFLSARLVFQLNGEEIASQDIELPVGEGAGSHEAALSAITFDMPAMENDYQLDLILEVSLSNGEQLTANGGSWYFSNGAPQMSAG